MGLSDITSRMSYIGDGSSTIFPFPHKFFNAADLNVFLFNTACSSFAAQFLGTAPSGNYTISGAQDSQGVYQGGGNVVFNSAFPSSQELVVFRNPSLVQNFSLAQNQPINSYALVQQLDYLTALVQRQQDQNSRCLLLPDGIGPVNGSTFSMALPSNITSVASSAGQILAVNSGANGWALVSVPGTGSILPVAQGGTGQGGPLNIWGVVYAVNSSTMSTNVAGSQGQVLTANSGAAPTWAGITVGSGATGILITSNGGTNNSNYTLGQLIFASSASTLSSLPSTPGVDQPLVGQAGSPGMGFSALNLASGSSVKSILPVGFGGTGTGTSFILNGVLFASSATQVANTAQGALNQVLTGQGANPPIFQQLNIGSGSLIIGSVSLTSQVVGTLPIAQGGTNQTIAVAAGQVWFGSSNVAFGQTTGGTVGQALTYQGSSGPTWASVVTNPMTTGGDIIVGSGSGTPVRLANGNSGQVLTSNGTTVLPSWQTPGSLVVQTKTATYNAVNTDGIVVAASGCGQVNLYGPPNNTGSVIRVKKTSTAPNDVVLVTCSNGSIDGSSYLCTAQYDAATFVSDGTNWQLIEAKNITPVQSCNPALIGFGTISSSYFFSQKIGGSLKLNGSFFATQTTGSQASISMAFGGTSVITTTFGASFERVGSFMLGSTGGTTALVTPGTLLSQPGSPGMLLFITNGTGNGSFGGQLGNAVAPNSATPNQIAIEAFVPILNWM